MLWSPMHRLLPTLFQQPGRRLLGDLRGAIAVEFALILPILLLFLLGIVQFGSAFFMQNNMLNTARELARRLATEQITVHDAERWAIDRLPALSTNYRIAVTAPDPDDPDANFFRVVINAPLADAVIVDPLGMFRSGELQAEVFASAQK
jgi:Flp pilus assembly protein TadG